MARSTPKFTRRDFEFLADKITPHLHWPTESKRLLMNLHEPIQDLIVTNG